MPYIMQDGSNELLLWMDDLCYTCKLTGSCPFISAIRLLEIITYDGAHVASCDGYSGDEPNMTLDTDVDEAKTVNFAVQMQNLEKKLRELEAAASALQELVPNE